MKQIFFLIAALSSVQAVRAQTDITITEPASTSTNSVIIGVGTISGFPTGYAMRNTVVGYQAGQADVSQNTVYVGAFAGNGGGPRRGSQHNVGVGAFAGYGQYLSTYNVMIGDSAGFGIGSAYNNVMVGASAGFNGAAGGSNTFVGGQAGRNTGSGAINTFIGVNSGKTNQDGNANAFIGAYAGENHQSGDYNTFVGAGAGNQNVSGTENTFVGTNAGYRTVSRSNTMLGTYAGFKNTSGQFNTFVGVQAGINNTTGSSNFIMGTNAGSSNTTGSANFFLGDNAGGNNTSGGFNVYLGANAGNGTGVNGDNNVAIGFESGRGNNGGVTNTFVGFRADATANGLTNASALGTNAKVSQSNSLVLGDGANVGIGSSAPANKLHIVGGLANTAGIRLPITSGSAVLAVNQTKFLTVNAQGDVILGSTNNGGREAADAGLWQRSGPLLKSAGGESVVIGNGVGRTPAGYKLFVEGGILTERVKVAVKDTSDWSDKVFAPAYPLKSLAEVEQYINRHQHLPGVPSADEVVKNGVDVGRMDAKLLEKIEELTLYSIQLEKSNQKQQTQIDELKKLVHQLLLRK